MAYNWFVKLQDYYSKADSVCVLPQAIDMYRVTFKGILNSIFLQSILLNKLKEHTEL